MSVVACRQCYPQNRLGLAKVIVENKMSRFLWFTVYEVQKCRLTNLVKNLLAILLLVAHKTSTDDESSA